MQFFAITSIVLVRMLIQQLLQDRLWLKFTVLTDVVSQEQVVLRLKMAPRPIMMVLSGDFWGDFVGDFVGAFVGDRSSS